MLPRNKSSKHGQVIPQDWAESVARLLNETYKADCKQNGRYFDVFGQIYPEELLMIVSYLYEKDEFSAPISLFLSCEKNQMNTVEKVKSTQKNYIDLAGLFFDEILNQDEWNEFEPAWQEVKHKEETYYFRISRENVSASIEADKLLGEEFSEFDDDVDYQ